MTAVSRSDIKERLLTCFKAGEGPGSYVIGPLARCECSSARGTCSCNDIVVTEDDIPYRVGRADANNNGGVVRRVVDHLVHFAEAGMLLGRTKVFVLQMEDDAKASETRWGGARRAEEEENVLKKMVEDWRGPCLGARLTRYYEARRGWIRVSKPVNKFVIKSNLKKKQL